MHQSRQKTNLLFHFVSTVLLVASVVYLVYKIAHYADYDELLTAIKNSNWSNFIWLAAVFALLPLNLLMEALKWKKVSYYLEKLKISTAIKGIIAGASSGFVTPNRLGDIIGRMHFLKPENRKSAVSLAAVNSLTQNIAIMLPGIPLAILFFLQQKTEIQSVTYLVFLFAILILFSITLLLLPRIANSMKIQKLQPYFIGLKEYAVKDLIIITAWSLLRFLIFCLQLFLMLRFFGVELSITQALTSIPLTYLLVTFTPSFAFSEAVIRGSWAVFVIGQFAANTPGILMAGVGLWFINVIIPVVIGNILLLKLRFWKAS